MLNLGSVITAMITPFDEFGDVDLKKAARLAFKLYTEGSDSILVAGTTGESSSLTRDEKFKLLETVINESNGQFPVIAGTGTYNTESSLKQTLLAEKMGADAVLLVAPYYNKPPQEGLYLHFASIAEKCSIPIILYNIPGRTGVNIANSTVEKLRLNFPHIAAIKDAAGNMDQTSELSMIMQENGHTGKGFKIFSGDDSLTLPMLTCGASGVISVASHIASRQISNMIKAYFAGNISEASRLHLELFPLFKGLFETTNPILVKEAVTITWENVGTPRSPLVKATEVQRQKLHDLLSSKNIIRSEVLTA